MTNPVDDEAEWENPNNWHATLFYFAPRDSRTFVPKRAPGIGLTVNFAKLTGIAFVSGIIVIVLFFVLHAAKKI